MIDNFKQIAALIDRKFSMVDDVFFLVQCYKRRKDNPDMEKDMILLDNFYINSIPDLFKKEARIKKVCIDNNARAYIRLNRRSYKRVALETLRLIAESIASDNYDVKGSYLKAAGIVNSDPNKWWIIDVDDKSHLQNVMDHINRITRPETQKVIDYIPTKNGFHIVTVGFDTSQYMCKDIADIKKDANTILFCL